ncbi:hypothetical protein VHEMI08027 [[Torrubiella] hemipterigena]|uniref:Phosphoglycerate mutase family protein n=1 Tax=[Torrubiella] hemipterigena TaxID=1531966 RepID=A0A0A1TMQ7_9HYPO|nr:hypothetical protein VHEMI08027 [[Torrubiella] hemipterigena]
MKSTGVVCALLASAVAVAAAPAVEAAEATKPTIYLIRHAEKDSHGLINERGKQREKCLVNLFGKDSDYDINYMIAPKYHDGKPVTERPYNSTLPLAESLGLKIHDKCEYDDMKCAAKQALAYKGPGNVLVAWEHVRLRKVSEYIGADDVPKYPDDRFDLIYTQKSPYTEVVVTSEECPGLDD